MMLGAWVLLCCSRFLVRANHTTFSISVLVLYVLREPPDEGIMCELLWSDPSAIPGRQPSKRGVGVAFGERRG